MQPMIDVVYYRLCPKQKLSLCEQLFEEPRSFFVNTAMLLWPEINKRDIRALENHLKRIRKGSMNV